MTTCSSERVVRGKRGPIKWPCIVKDQHVVHEDVMGYKWCDEPGPEWRIR